jgi:hypothetical protein
MISEYSSAQQVFYDLKVAVNIMSKTLVDQTAVEEPLSFFHKQLKWIDSKMGTIKIFLDFHIFNIPEGEAFIFIGLR